MATEVMTMERTTTCASCRGTGEIFAGGPTGGGRATQAKLCPICCGAPRPVLCLEVVRGGVARYELIQTIASEEREHLMNLLRSADPEPSAVHTAIDALIAAAEHRGVRWGLDHCHDLAVARGLGNPNVSTDRDAVAIQVATQARAKLSRKEG